MSFQMHPTADPRVSCALSARAPAGLKSLLLDRAERRLVLVQEDAHCRFGGDCGYVLEALRESWREVPELATA